jgi:hypothetical protein
MYYVEDMPFWRIKYNKNLLEKFKIEIKYYYTQKDKTEQSREWISKNLYEIFYAVRKTHTNTSMSVKPAGTHAYCEKDDIIGSCLYLYKFDNPSIKQNLIWLEDIVNCAIGVYEKNYKKAIFKTFFPIWWIEIFSKYFMTKFVDIIGLQNNVTVSKLINFLSKIFPWAASVVALYKFFMYGDV